MSRTVMIRKCAKNSSGVISLRMWTQYNTKLYLSTRERPFNTVGGGSGKFVGLEIYYWDKKWGGGGLTP